MSGRRRVLIVEENSYIPLDVRVWNEATTLRDAGWQVTVVCPIFNGAHPGTEERVVVGLPEDIDGVTVYRFPLVPAERGVSSYLSEYVSAFYSIARLSWRVWRNGGFDIIHFCNPPDIFFPIAVFFRLLGARVVFDHHDLFPELISWRYRGLAGGLLYAVARVTEYLTFRYANVVISTNQSYRRVAMERGGTPSDRAIVVRNGPKTAEFAPVNSDPTLKHGYPFLACYVGVMGHEDGVLEVLQSIRHIVRDLGRRDVRFVLVGDGALRSEALAHVETWGLNGFVDMPGMVHDKLLLRQYMCTADVLLAPEPLTPLNARSTFIKVGEYMAMGKPIVAYDLAETRYTAQEGAVYIKPGNFEGFGQAIVDLLDDPEQRRQMGEYGRQRHLDQLSWEHQQAELLRAYAVALGA